MIRFLLAAVAALVGVSGRLSPSAEAQIADGRTPAQIARACGTSTSPECQQARRDDAFEIAQQVNTTETASALSRVTARALAPTPEAARLAEEFDAEMRARTDALGATLGAITQGQTNSDGTALSRSDQRLEELQTQLGAVYSTYVSLKSPAPLSMSEAQALLGPDEALIVYSRPRNATFVWVVTRETADWARIPVGEEGLLALVQGLRENIEDHGKSRPFDLAGAHALYGLLLGPVERLAMDKRTLILVPSGPLLSVPFAALPMDEGRGGAEGRAALQSAKWLGLERALVVLPHPSSLRLLRAQRHSAGAQSFVGFGDPVFVRSATTPTSVERLARSASTTANIDQSLLETLRPLPGSGREIAQLGALFNTGDAAVYTGVAATERQLKSLDLSRVRVLSFATHGVLPQEIDGLDEAGLVFTPPRLQSPPAAPSDLDNGFLSVSEAAALKLNADWVILSACNTALGGRPGDESLSGLARAFFAAGAKALLVSQWAVEDTAAERLVVRTVQLSLSGVPRAESLRQAMNKLASDEATDFSHPAFWAPFLLVGDSSAIN